MDLIQWLFASSDPLVASNRITKYMKKERSLPQDVINMLRAPNINDYGSDDEDSDGEADDEDESRDIDETNQDINE